MDAVRTKPATAPSERDVDTLYEQFFGTPALDGLTEEERESDAFARVYETAKENPWVALRAVYEGLAAHFRGAHPFNYSVGEARENGEVAQ